jgi:hypothetical protein
LARPRRFTLSQRPLRPSRRSRPASRPERLLPSGTANPDKPQVDRQLIAAAAVESMTNRVIGRGAHRLLRARLAVREGGLQDACRHWYPCFQMPVGGEATPT